MSEMKLEDLIRSCESESKKLSIQSIEKEKNETNKHQIEAKNSQKQSLLDKIKELPSKADLISKNFQLWARKRKNLGFYKKYLDRVQSGLYDKYGGEAEVLENQMIDDPVVILKTEAKTYIHDIVEGINEVYVNILELTKKLENVSEADRCIRLVNKYIGSDILDQNIKGEKSESKSYKDKLFQSTKMKIAKVLMKNGERKVYGYTVKNIVLKNYPTPNHLIVTLFVDNPELKPQEQPVNQIFKSVESFEILADSDKKDIFNVSNMTKAALEKTVDNKVMNTIEQYKANALNHFKQANLENKKEQGKIIDQIWDGIKLSSKELLSRKSYIIECINVYYSMILRIDKLAVNSINAMLAIENMNLDKKYQRHLKVSKMSDSQRHKLGYDPVDEESSGNEKDHSNIKRMTSDLNSGKGTAARRY